MAIGSVGFGGINPLYNKTQAKKADKSETKKTETDARQTAEISNKSAWASDLEKKVTEKKDTTEKSDSDEAVYTNGKTVGKPTLSKKAAAYYETLKKKFSNMDFVLVSEDQKANAQANAAAYASPNKKTVLINEDKIEQMAADPEYAKKYENIIENSAKQLDGISKDLESKLGKDVLKGVGMQVEDNGMVRFFATVRDQNKVSNEALQKRQAAKKAAAKEAAKKSAKKAAEKKAEEKKAEKAEKSRTGTADQKSTDTKTDAAKDTKTQTTADTKAADRSSDSDDDFTYVEKNPGSSDTGEVTPWDMYGTKTIYANSIEDLYNAVSGYLSGSDAYTSGNSVDYHG
ncbi:MAG: hypothetical protein DUD27_00735 [Lachnospiraceae bacterium]|uniref:Uncharacterized protein n=1 Tax=Candidatus Weimeria bifida TaxID=2599074 RepID=A0A6N7J3L9_9FIRM|nr:hypothetical protein [Candidatus Weimeria bifida]RRF97433.1 MAG: hypothetical protein DUD27_00735 [Lachnospiraceae bacterium]